MHVCLRQRFAAAVLFCAFSIATATAQTAPEETAFTAPPPPPPLGMGTLQPKNIPAPPPPIAFPGSNFSPAPFRQTLERTQNLMNRAASNAAPDISWLQQSQNQFRAQFQELVKQQSQLLNLLDKQTQQQKLAIEHNDQLRQEISQLYSERANWQAERARLTDLDANILQLNERIASEQQNTAAMEAELGQLDSLRSEIQVLTNQRDELLASLDQAKSGLEFSDNSLTEVTAQLKTAENENSELLAQLNTLNMEFETARQTMLSSEAERNIIPQLKQTLISTSDELELLRTDSQKLDTENTALKTELEQLKAELGTARTQIETANSNTGEAELIQQALTKANEENNSLKEQIEVLSIKQVEQETALLAAQATGGQLSDFETQVSSLTTELQATQTQRDELNAALEAAKTQLTDSSALQMELTGAQTSLAEQAEQLELLHNAKIDMETQIAALTEQNQAMTQELETLRADNSELSIALTNAKESLTTKDADFQRLTEESRALTLASNSKVTDFQKQLSSLQANLDDARKERDQFRLKTQDSDKDGISDLDDQCPKTGKGFPVNADGCEPDGDADGMADRLDLCPNSTAGGKTDEMGCLPEENIALQGVTFEPGTDQLTEGSLSILDKVVDVLKQHKKLKLEVAGHTDNTGPEALNMQLSSARADSVKNYLIENGIKEKRLESNGYGPNAPIADNNTRDGRAQNRRVELRRQ